MTEQAGIGPAGSMHYRSFVGAPERYDLAGAGQFMLLVQLGLREHHTVLDVGCGSLRAGRLLIPYLLPDRYYGIEPEAWLVEQGIEQEVGVETRDRKHPTFAHRADFDLTCFGRTFDFVIAHSVFSHAAPEQIRSCLRSARHALAPTGMFAFTFAPGTTDYDGDDWVYPGLVTYRRPTLAAMAGDAGLRIVFLEWAHWANQRWGVVVHADAPPDLVPSSIVRPPRWRRGLRRLIGGGR